MPPTRGRRPFRRDSRRRIYEPLGPRRSATLPGSRPLLPGGRPDRRHVAVKRRASPSRACAPRAPPWDGAEPTASGASFDPGLRKHQRPQGQPGQGSSNASFNRRSPSERSARHEPGVRARADRDQPARSDDRSGCWSTARARSNHVMVGSRSRHRAARTGGAAGRARSPARPALHPHPSRRRGPVPRRPDGPRAAAPRRHGLDRRPRGWPARASPTRPRCGRPTTTAAGDGRGAASIPAIRRSYDLDFQTPGSATSRTSSARSVGERPRGRRGRAGDPGLGERGPRPRRPSRCTSTSCASWRAPPASRSIDVVTASQRPKRRPEDRDGSPASSRDLVIRCLPERRRPGDLRSGPDAHPGAQPERSAWSCASSTAPS